MNKYCFTLLFTGMLLTGAIAKAQTYREDYRGRPYMAQGHIDAEGNPFLSDNWFPGTVTFLSGKTASLKLKYNIYSDELLFQKPSDSTVQAFVFPVKSFSLPDVPVEGSDLTAVVFKSQFPPVDAQTANTFYEVVADGKVELLRLFKKKLRSSKEFNSATTVQTFVLEDSYYLYSNSQMSKIKPNQKAILAAMNDKAAEVQKFIKANAINFKSDAALAKLFNYYNSL